MKQISATFGQTLSPAEARTYIVHQLPHMPASVWRRSTLEYLHQAMGALGADDFRGVMVGLGLGEEVAAMRRGSWKVDTIFSAAGALKQLAVNWFELPDWMWAQLCAYSPAIAGDAEWIEEHATDGEIADAFVQVLLHLALDIDEARLLAKLVNTIEAKRVPGAVSWAEKLRRAL